jgi:hypothetical protein
MCVVIIYYHKISGKLFTITTKNLHIFNHKSLNQFKQSFYTCFENVYYRKKDINLFKKKNKISYYLLKPIARFYPMKNNEINSDEISSILNNEKCFNHFYSFKKINYSELTNIGMNNSLIYLLHYIFFCYKTNKIFSNFDISILDIIFKKVSKNLIYINNQNSLSLSDDPLNWENF